MQSQLTEKSKSEIANDGCLSSSTVNQLKREFSSLDKAKNYFLKVIKEKTLHSFDSEKFVKYPAKCKLNIALLDEKFFHTNDSLLPTSIENLMKLIFDVDFTKKTIEELNVDTDKICLEQFSLKQIIDAMMVIEAIWHQINRGEAQDQFIDLSSNYYTLIPYKQKVPIICTYEQVTAEVRNLKGLFAIVQSYNLIREEISKKISIIDRYHRLNTEIIPIHRSDYEFKLLEEYAKVTNYQTNDELEIEEIFKLSRKGEEERFEPFQHFSNRYLLWHGTFLTNYVSIFGHGLKIAPNEIPRLGKKFGKGVYFADMISKSTKFCVTGTENRAGLMLLCEVAMGDIDECTETIFNGNANSLYELPKNKHSVKRIGKFKKNPIQWRKVNIPARFLFSCFKQALRIRLNP